MAALRAAADAGTATTAIPSTASTTTPSQPPRGGCSARLSRPFCPTPTSRGRRPPRLTRTVGAQTYGATVAVQVEAYIRQRLPETPDGSLGETRSITVEAASFDDAKQQVLAQLPGADWIVLSWRVT